MLLNSDTVVTAGWLDALARCAASDPRIGTATPFSNNAEICSFPRFCADNPWPEGADPEPVRAALARAAVPTYPELPTGVGFCLYVRRALIDAIGIFDPVFGKGYGEENDFCLRAAQAGFRNVLCDDAFVLHAGERSFAGRKTELGARNMPLLLERHPRYLDVVRGFIAADPLRPLRAAAQAQLHAYAGPAGVLHVIHGHGGGTEHHVRALIDASRARFRHYLATAIGDRWQVEEHLDDGARPQLRFPPSRRRAVARLRRRPLRDAAHRPPAPAQRLRLPRRHPRRARRAARAVRLHASTTSTSPARRSPSSGPTGCTAAAQTDAAVCGALPRGAAGVRGRRRRRLARAPPRRCSRAPRS